MQGKAANRHMLLRMIRKIKLSSDWFECVLVISFYVAKVFSESITKSSSSFTNIKLFAISASSAVDNIGESTSEVISDLYVSLRSRLINERTSFAS